MNPNSNNLRINEGEVVSPIQVGGIADVMPRIITLILVGAALITLAMLLWGGIKYITSSGDPEKASQAKGTITFAIIGFVITGLSFAIWVVVGNIIGFKLV